MRWVALLSFWSDVIEEGAKLNFLRWFESCFCRDS